MVLKLYGTPYSGNVRRVACVIAECGLFNDQDFELIEVNRDDIKLSPHSEKSPLGLMPYLEDTSNGSVIIESRAISRYIALKSRSKLLPMPSGDEEGMKRWIAFEEACSIESTIWDPPIWNLARELKMKKDQFGQDPDMYLVEHFQGILEKRFKYLEQILGKQKYLAGDEVTLADLFCLPYGERMTQGGNKALVDGTYPNIARWWASLIVRDSWSKANSLQR